MNRINRREFVVTLAGAALLRPSLEPKPTKEPDVEFREIEVWSVNSAGNSCWITGVFEYLRDGYIFRFTEDRSRQFEARGTPVAYEPAGNFMVSVKEITYPKDSFYE